jgi:hypothetical protein
VFFVKSPHNQELKMPSFGSKSKAALAKCHPLFHCIDFLTTFGHPVSDPRSLLPNDLAIMHIKDTAVAALGDEIQLKFAPGSKMRSAGTTMDWRIEGHILREGEIDRVAVGTLQLIVKALGLVIAHVSLLQIMAGAHSLSQALVCR